MTDESTRAGEPEPPARTRILRAAEVLFARDGFDRTPVSQVAKLAEVPHGLVFYYFQTKIGLLLAVINEYGSELAVVLDDVAADGAGRFRSPFELVDDTLGTMRRQLGHRAEIRRIVFHEMSAHPEVRRLAQTFHERATDTVSARFQRGMAELGRPVDRTAAVTAARMVITTMVMTAMLYEQETPRTSLTDLAAATARSLESAAAG